MSTTRSEKVAIVGTGVIGASWAAYYLAQGFTVAATDPGEGAEVRLRSQVDKAWPALESLGLADGASRDNLSFSTDVAATVAGAVFIQENGPERIDIKRGIIADIEAGAPKDTIIATSSSGLLISEAQAEAKHPERIVLGHPFNPPHIIPLVEVLGGNKTSEESVQKAMDFYTRVGKRPIRINKEVKGHVANRLQVALWREAFSLVENGVVSVADIDTAISQGPGLRWALLGPFLNLHASGGDGGITHVLEHIGPAQREWARDLGEYPETDDYIGTMAEGVDRELEGFEFAETLRARDELLLKLIAAKKQTPALP